MIPILAYAIPVLTLAYIVVPLFRRDVEEWSVPEREVDTLEEKKRMLRTAIRELDFDYATGKLDDIDYKEQRRGMNEELQEVLSRLKEATAGHVQV